MERCHVCSSPVLKYYDGDLIDQRRLAEASSDSESDADDRISCPDNVVCVSRHVLDPYIVP